MAMTDKDIIDGLACCGRYGTGCEECPYKGRYPCSETLIDDASALLDRKMQEIEDLNATIHSIITAQVDLTNNIIRTSLEEFTERLKEAGIYIHREIDKVVKEIAGDNDD